MANKWNIILVQQTAPTCSNLNQQQTEAPTTWLSPATWPPPMHLCSQSATLQASYKSYTRGSMQSKINQGPGSCRSGSLLDQKISKLAPENRTSTYAQAHTRRHTRSLNPKPMGSSVCTIQYLGVPLQLKVLAWCPTTTDSLGGALAAGHLQCLLLLGLHPARQSCLNQPA